MTFPCTLNHTLLAYMPFIWLSSLVGNDLLADPHNIWRGVWGKVGRGSMIAILQVMCMDA